MLLEDKVINKCVFYLITNFFSYNFATKGPSASTPITG